MRHIVVVGAGQMGAGIAHAAALAGFSAGLHDQDPTLPAKAVAGIVKRLEGQVQKGTLESAARDAIVARLHPQTTLDLQDADIVIEAVSEREALKFDIFRKLDTQASAGTILASNTSSISITAIAAQTRNPARVVGMHFMNPVPLMQLVEIVRGLETSDATLAAVDALARAMGKTPVTVDDAPGFVSNRILMPMINEAICALHEGVADIEGIDTVMRLGMNHPLGPLALADLIGLDTCLAILEVLLNGTGDPKYRASPLLRRYVAAGRFGRKSGHGFYRYGSDGSRVSPSDRLA
jgi:3-hydroxybutyryl-CoA dehydrogenase